MAALEIRWETVETLTRSQAVVTGEVAEETEAEEPVSLFAQFDRPVVILVAERGSPSAELAKLEENVFSQEKLGLAMKAFRTVRMSGAAVEADPLLADQGREMPRLLILNPAKEDVIVLENNKLSAGRIYSTLEKVARSAYDERLDKVVKAHLKLLNEQDQMQNELQVLQQKEQRIAEDDNERKLEDVREEIAELKEKMAALDEQEKGLWNLTARS